MKELDLADDHETIIFLYLVLPFGWRASPGYFSKIGEAITVAHQQYASGVPDRDGADPFTSQLFVDDAIFIEPCLGARREMVIECWENVCRGLLGEDAINDAKMKVEGQWSHTHILLGFEVNVEKLTIRLPTAKQCDALEKSMILCFTRETE